MYLEGHGHHHYNEHSRKHRAKKPKKKIVIEVKIMQPATEANQRIAKSVTIKWSKRTITEISSASEMSKTTNKIRMKGNPPCEVREISKTI